MRTALFLLLLMVPACSGLKVEGDCIHVREVKVTYQCEPGSTIEHYRVAPNAPD